MISPGKVKGEVIAAIDRTLDPLGRESFQNTLIAIAERTGISAGIASQTPAENLLPELLLFLEGHRLDGQDVLVGGLPLRHRFPQEDIVDEGIRKAATLAVLCQQLLFGDRIGVIAKPNEVSTSLFGDFCTLPAALEPGFDSTQVDDSRARNAQNDESLPGDPFFGKDLAQGPAVTSSCHNGNLLLFRPSPALQESSLFQGQVVHQ
jgi:hypothetical protein